ncbi:GNAT family N-acetyltransferase [Arthrobacter sp. NA-172]|uniref:GNAT family N-acetyltransferase n=1 Tax=Arthrobacter sp. NA-172 TaxID=3367524 RepID=UPI0037545B71
MATNADVRIRLLGPDDADALIRLAATDNLFDEDPSVEPSGTLTYDAARSFLGDPSVLFWLAESGGETVGFLHCCIQRRRIPGPWAELLLLEMGTHVDWRHRGIGRSLLAVMEEWMRAQEITEVWVPANVYATGFYEKCGFAQDEGEILVKALG